MYNYLRKFIGMFVGLMFIIAPFVLAVSMSIYFKNMTWITLVFLINITYPSGVIVSRRLSGADE